MLKANEIPKKEPLLRVGIILPEDSKDSVKIEFPADPLYYVKSDNSKKLDVHKTILEFTLSNNTIHCEGHSAKRWIVSPQKEAAIRVWQMLFEYQGLKRV